MSRHELTQHCNPKYAVPQDTRKAPGFGDSVTRLLKVPSIPELDALVGDLTTEEKQLVENVDSSPTLTDEERAFLGPDFPGRLIKPHEPDHPGRQLGIHEKTGESV